MRIEIRNTDGKVILKKIFLDDRPDLVEAVKRAVQKEIDVDKSRVVM